MWFLSRLSPRMRKVFDWVTGLALIALGIVGFVVPVLQGWVFVLMGLAVLSSHNRHAKAIYDRLKSMGRSVRDKVTQKRDQHRKRRGRRSRASSVARREDASLPAAGDDTD